MTIVLFATLPQTIQPSIDVDYSAVKIELPPGTRLDDTIRAADTAAALLSKQPEVEPVFEDVGQGGQDIRMDMLYLPLKEPCERDRKSVASGKSRSVRLDLGVRVFMKKKTIKK